MNDKFQITIASRGEAVIYKDADGEFHFDVGYEPPFAILHAGTYWNGALPYAEHVLTPQQRETIIPRLVRFFTERGDKLKVADLRPEDQLPEHYRR
jgi:hypothetical protein